jgi:hypothetical protein
MERLDSTLGNAGGDDLARPRRAPWPLRAAVWPAIATISDTTMPMSLSAESGWPALE